MFTKVITITANNSHEPNESTKELEEKPVLSKDIGTDYNYKFQIYWPNAIGFLLLHLLCIWGFWMLLSGQTKWQTAVWSFIVMYVAAEGVTIGAHRLYTHKSFKATMSLRLVLVLMQTMAGQNCMYTWVRDHRLHHRYSDTDADPHNSKRGFFFSHIGWLMHKKHPMIRKLGKNIDMSDLEADGLVMFQKKYFKTVYLLIGVIIPVAVPIYFFDENWFVSVMIAYVHRYAVGLNGTWTVNSFAHIYGTRPYDKNLQAVESWFVSFISSGEGWHNYHHAYPWDYKAADLGMRFNLSAMYIEWFEKLGLAYDLKKVPADVVNSRILRTGDGTHQTLGTEEARATVATFGGVFVHPINPFYSSGTADPEVALDEVGMPVMHEDEELQANIAEYSKATKLTRRRNLGSVE